MELPSISVVLQFAIATMLPVLVSATLTMLERRTRLDSMPYWPRQVLYGVIFGAVAIYGTEAGIVTHDATMNVRDAAPLVAGLYFGGPAGIIAGLIGGVERWFAALWGRGMFTRFACSLATVAAGLYAAAMRRFLFGGHRPRWTIAFGLGVVAEVFHLLLIFVTNLNDPMHAFLVVQACNVPMVMCNAFSVSLSGIAMRLAEGGHLRQKEKTSDISQQMQLGLLGVVVIGFAIAFAFVLALFTSLVRINTQELFLRTLGDVEDDVEDASNSNLLALAGIASYYIPTTADANQELVDELTNDLDLAELNVVDKNGIIVASNDAARVGFDMASNKRMAEFLSLLPGGGEEEYVQDYQPTSIDRSEWRKFAAVTIGDGFVQVGYDQTRFVGELTEQISTAVANRHVGATGFIAILSNGNELVAANEDVGISDEDVKLFVDLTDSVGEHELLVADFHNERYLAMYGRTLSMKILVMQPLDEAEISRDLMLMVYAFMEVLIFAAIFIGIYVLVGRIVVRSIRRVNDRLGQITKGDLGVEVDVRDNLEFALLSDDINATVSALRDAIAQEGRRIEKDLTTARSIQVSALPRTFPPFPNITEFDIYASMDAAREVGGDFYDFFLVDDHTLGFLIADVSGKGIPAALFMMEAKSELANSIKSGLSLSEAVRKANWNLCQGNDTSVFVTVWAGKLDYKTGQLEYVNAGHNYPLLRHEGVWQWLDVRGGLFLGAFEEATYRESTIMLDPGDELMLYTDGVNEAFNVNEEEYGNDRLEAFLNNYTDLGPHMMIDMLRDDVARWAEGAVQSDDITMLCLEFGVSPELVWASTVPATTEGLDELLRHTKVRLAQLGCPHEAQADLEVLVRGLLDHTLAPNGERQAEPGDIRLSYYFDAERDILTVELADWCAPNNPLAPGLAAVAAEDPNLHGALSRLDDIAYVRDGDANLIAFKRSW